MTSTAPELALRHHDPAETLKLRGFLVPIYAATHAHLLDQPWYGPDEWWNRLADIYSKTRDFDLVTGWDGETIVGYAFGSPSDTGKQWPAIHVAFPHLEPVGAVYIFREFAVAPERQRRGYGRLIHDELLLTRPEQAAHLLVRKDNEAAQAAYREWAWKHIGEVKPFENSPTFDAMALDLQKHR
jgi:ribosomal protein S18 acetylase RimI-like enzyme